MPGPRHGHAVYCPKCNWRFLGHDGPRCPTCGCPLLGTTPRPAEIEDIIPQNESAGGMDARQAHDMAGP